MSLLLLTSSASQTAPTHAPMHIPCIAGQKLMLQDVRCSFSCMVLHIKLLVIVSLLVVCSQESIASDTLRLTLEDCIRIAHEKGPAAKVVRFTYQSRRAQYTAINADFMPQVSLNVDVPGYQRAIVPVLLPNATYTNLPQSLAYSYGALSLSQKVPLTGGDITVQSGLNNRIDFTNNKSELWNSFPFLVQVRQPIFGFNQYQNNRELEELRFDAATREYIEQMEDVSVEAVGKYFDYYIATMNVDNAKLNVEINDSIFTLAKGRYNVGKIAENDLLQNELALITAKTDFERTSLETERTLRSLQLTLGLPENSPLVIIPPDKVPNITVDATKALEYAKKFRSDTKNLEAQSLQSERAVDAAKADNRFNATLTASYGLNQTASTFAGVYQSPLDQQRVSLGVEVPLLTWGKNSANVEQAMANQQRTEVQTALQKNQITQEVEFHVKDFLQLQKQVAIALKGEQIAARGYEVARNRYIIGKIETTELMLAQQRKDGSRREYFQTLRNFWTSYYRLRRLTLWDFATNQQITLPG